MDWQELRTRIGGARLAVLGDFCLDIYWLADMRRSELSRETPHFPLPVTQERHGAGGAGNVVANILALRPRSVQCIGVFGDDWRGDIYQRLLLEQGADTRGVFRESGRWTDTYIKPLRRGHTGLVYEDPRIDFANATPPSAETEAKVLSALENLKCDVLCVCDQMPFGCVTPRVREKIAALGEAGLTVVVDSRDRIGEYRHVIAKPNEVEACRLLGMAPTRDLDVLERAARMLAARNERPAIVTAGDLGCLVATVAGETTHVFPVPVTGEIDICGAGDTFLAATSCALAAGCTLDEAAALGCRAAAITVRKLRTTGTATWEELQAADMR